MDGGQTLKKPWLVAVWPGIGQVALSAGFYLMAKLGMHQVAEFSASGLFDVEHITVKSGRVQPTFKPRNRCFVWKAPDGERDILVFIGEAQPPIGKFTFCEQLIDFAINLGVERVFTFAAMATEMHPDRNSRVFAAATDDQTLASLQDLNVELLEEAHISGLNGILIAAALERGVSGTCLLGEMPHIFAQMPYPKASLAVLKVFAGMTNLKIDFQELEEQASDMDAKLGELLSRLEQRLQTGQQGELEEEYPPNPLDEGLSEAERQKIENLFRAAAKDRSKAYELKSELDRLEIFREYEDRFLDLFKPGDQK
jgi:proteasome assembly chaperone (PAC2) family protein